MTADEVIHRDAISSFIVGKARRNEQKLPWSNRRTKAICIAIGDQPSSLGHLAFESAPFASD
jgi:hypothetical protein